MSRSLRGMVLALSALSLAVPAAVWAAAPQQFDSSFTYTLADAEADYEAFGSHAGDCGDFVLLVDYAVERHVTIWPDREVRHVHYDGHFYSSADTSRSIVRSGDFNIEFALDTEGNPTSITRTGVMDFVIIDGRRVNTHVGRDVLDFATGPVSATPRAGADLRELVCDALR
jgi:hypothetical protein